MDIKKIKYVKLNGEIENLEKWMIFSIELARFLKLQSEPVKLYVSVPSNLLFSYMFVLGCIDFDFKNVNEDRLKKKYLLLKPGQRVLFKVDGNWVAHSVKEIGLHPITKKKAIILKGRLNASIYVSEERWSTHINIYNNEITEILNTRKVNNVLNISENEVLNSLYEKEKLQLAMMENTPNTYIYTNKTEWNKYKDTLRFQFNENVSFGLDNILFDSRSSIFRNIHFIDLNEYKENSEDSVKVLIGSSRTLRKLDLYKKEKCAIIVDRHELNEKIEDLHFKIENDFLSKLSLVINDQLIEYLKVQNIAVPEGVEVVVWIP